MSETPMKERLRMLSKKYEHVIPWLLLLIVAGGTFALLQVLVVKLLK